MGRPKGSKNKQHKANPHYMCPTYRSWAGMLTRCRNPNRDDWLLYGGRGITVCDRWDPRKGGSFANFLADMGERPEGKTLDRLNSDGNYLLQNCRWATASEQIRGRRTGWYAHGEKSYHARLTWAQVREIREAWKALPMDPVRGKRYGTVGKMIHKFMSKFNVSYSCITKIIYKSSWQEAEMPRN